jgi:hypothetical protein
MAEQKKASKSGSFLVVFPGLKSRSLALFMPAIRIYSASDKALL